MNINSIFRLASYIETSFIHYSSGPLLQIYYYNGGNLNKIFSFVSPLCVFKEVDVFNYYYHPGH